MKNVIIIIIVALAIIGIAYYFLIYKKPSVEGMACTLSGIPGIIKNGTCITIPNVGTIALPTSGKK